MELGVILSKTTARDECLLWAGPRLTVKGGDYGVLTTKEPVPHRVGYKNANHTTVLVHRLVWVLTNGKPIPKGMYVCHSCDTPACINPAHLWLGTPKQNTDDAKAKGRGKKASDICRRGHRDYVVAQSGRRHCRTCHREHQQRYVSRRYKP